MSHKADYTLQVPYTTATGSANTYAVTLNPVPTAYVDGMAIAVKINVNNTGASTININGLGAKQIKKPNSNDVSAGNLKAGSIYSMRYNGTNFILQGSDAAGNATPADVIAGKTFSNDQDTELTGTMLNFIDLIYYNGVFYIPMHVYLDGTGDPLLTCCYEEEHFFQSAGNRSSSEPCGWQTTSFIDLTPYSAIIVDMDTSVRYSVIEFVVRDPGGNEEQLFYTSSGSTKVDVENLVIGMDISHLSGSYRFRTKHWYTQIGNYSYARIYGLYLLKRIC